MLSPRDIYPPEWFTSTDERAASGEGKQKQTAPNYEVRRLASGCRVFQIINTQSKERKQ